MNVRKLISFGKNSYIISLPKQWVDKNKLSKGDLLSLEENKEGLLLKINSNEAAKEEPKTMVINAENKSLTLLKTEIVSAYLDNYNVIEVISRDLQSNAPEISAILQNLAGLEIINQTSTRIVAKDLINVKEISILDLIRRMDNITRAMSEDTSTCFEDAGHVGSLHNIDEDVNRLHFLAYRVIRSGLKDVRIANSLGKNALNLHSDHTVTEQIERIADNTKRICKYLKYTKLGERWRLELKKLFDDIKQSYFDVMKSYYTNDPNIALHIEEKNKELIKICDAFFDKHNHRGLKFGNGDKKGVCNFRWACGATAKIIENMKQMAYSVKYIARTVIGGG